MQVRRAHLLPNDRVSVASFTFKVFLGPDHAAPVIDGTEKHLPAVNGTGDHDTGFGTTGNQQPVIRRNELPDVYPHGED
jgi:hypothetical protein